MHVLGSMRRRRVWIRVAALALGLAVPGDRVRIAGLATAAVPPLRGVERLERPEGPSWKPAAAAGGVSDADDWLG